MIEVSELKGFKSLRAFNAFQTLMLGLKMLPAYRAVPYEDFMATIEAMPEADQAKVIREAATFVPLDEEEVKAMVCFCKDPNGVPYTSENIKNLNPQELIERIVAVCIAISKIKIDTISDAEKKK